MSQTINQNQPLILYGAMWCGDCRRSKRFLDNQQIAYNWIDVEQDPTARDTMQQYNGGRQSIPTIILPDGQVLVEPSDRELAAALAIPAR